MLMNELFDRYQSECLPSLSPRSRRDYTHILEKLRATFGTMTPQEVKPRHVRDFLEVPTGKIHRNRHVAVLSTVFYKAIGKWCVDDDLRNPCVKVERHKTQPRDRYVSDVEFHAFRQICSPQCKLAMDLALLTSQRQGDLIALTWSQIETSGPRESWAIRIRQGKTGKQMKIKISANLEQVLDLADALPPDQPHDYVIRNQFGNRYTSDGFRAMWQRHMREFAKAGHERFHFHDLRAKSISDNANLQAAYNLAGHIDMKVTNRVYDRGCRVVEPLR
jgi:integrase